MKKAKKMDFHWNYSTGGLMTRKGFGEDLNRVFAETLLRYSEPYTPWASKKPNAKIQQHMLDAGTVSGNKITGRIQYPGIPYADRQYYGDASWNRSTERNPMATSYWLEYAWDVHKQEISGTVGAYRRWHSK